ncbi:MAG TPA: TetR/AcrR family transcriptional regulator [Candidatus Acidoferrales bacterium]|nr:TetR/AcrR family transcriptional regulator [Candidatus Acidoferrales bacterium]
MAERNRRVEILDAATAVIVREGFQNASMKQIAAEAGISQSLIHHYFKNKEELLVRLLDRLDEEALAGLRRELEGKDDPLERFVAAMQVAVDLDELGRPFWSLMLDLMSASRSNPGLQEPVNRLIDRWLRVIGEEVASSAGRMPGPGLVPPEDVAAMTTGLVYGLGLILAASGRSKLPGIRAFVALIAAAAGFTYSMAGEEPPLERLLAMIQRFQPGELPTS